MVIRHFALCAALLISPIAAALDLGVIGPTYAIAEPDLLLELQAKLREKARSGELQLPSSVDSHIACGLHSESSRAVQLECFRCLDGCACI